MQGLNAAAILRQLREEGLLNGSESKPLPALPPLGPTLRTMRMERNKSLAEVAEAVEVSAGYLSNVERAQNEPSLSVLHRLAQYYGLDLSDLFGAIKGMTTPLVRPHDRKVLLRGHGVTMELLASGKVTMEPHLFRIAPGASSGATYTHQGEEFLFLVKGRLTITLEDQDYQLRAGDSFYFGSHLPHRWINSGRTETIVLWVNTPPAY
jgi:transcriptional regulator with XRE-family HTH domain